MRCGAVSSSVALATGWAIVLYDLRIKIHLIFSTELWGVLFLMLLSRLSICYLVEMYLTFFNWNLGFVKFKQLENPRQKVSNGYFSVQPLCGGWSELAAKSVASVEISIAFIQSCFNASS